MAETPDHEVVKVDEPSDKENAKGLSQPGPMGQKRNPYIARETRRNQTENKNGHKKVHKEAQRRPHRTQIVPITQKHHRRASQENGIGVLERELLKINQSEEHHVHGDEKSDARPARDRIPVGAAVVGNIENIPLECKTPVDLGQKE